MESKDRTDKQETTKSTLSKRPWYKNTVTLGQTLHVALTLAAFGLGWMASRQSEQARVLTLQLWDNYYSYLMIDANREGFAGKTTVNFEESNLQAVSDHLYIRNASISKTDDGYKLAGEVVNSAAIPLDGIAMRLFLDNGVHDVAIGDIGAGKARKFSVNLVGVSPEEFHATKLITRCDDIAYAVK